MLRSAQAGPDPCTAARTAYPHLMKIQAMLQRLIAIVEASADDAKVEQCAGLLSALKTELFVMADTMAAIE